MKVTQRRLTPADEPSAILRPSQIEAPKSASGVRLRWHAARRSSGLGAAFTLVEMLLVVAIIGLLAALIGPQIAKQFQKSRVQTTKAQMELLGTALESFNTDTGRYPTEAEGLKVLLSKPDALEGWNGPYLKKNALPKDGWGGEFIYKLDKDFGFRIRSLGADKREGGAPGSLDADLDNRT